MDDTARRNDREPIRKQIVTTETGFVPNCIAKESSKGGLLVWVDNSRNSDWIGLRLFDLQLNRLRDRGVHLGYAGPKRRAPKAYAI